MQDEDHQKHQGESARPVVNPLNLVIQLTEASNMCMQKEAGRCSARLNRMLAYNLAKMQPCSRTNAAEAVDNWGPALPCPGSGIYQHHLAFQSEITSTDQHDAFMDALPPSSSKDSPMQLVWHNNAKQRALLGGRGGSQNPHLEDKLAIEEHVGMGAGACLPDADLAHAEVAGHNVS